MLNPDQVKLVILGKALGVLSLHCETFYAFPKKTMRNALLLATEMASKESPEEIEEQYQSPCKMLKHEFVEVEQNAN